MAKQLNTAIKGKIDDYSFYQDRLRGYLVRRTGGVTGKQYRTDHKYAAARDASSEFASVSKAGKLVRSALRPFIDVLKDGSMVNRLNKELVALKQLDNKNGRGKRKPHIMMGDPDANKWLRIFQFNDNRKLYDLCANAAPCVQSFQRVRRVMLKPGAFPQGATHAGLRVIRTVINFDRNNFHTSASDFVFAAKNKLEEIQLLVQDTENYSGIEMTCLQVLFFEEQNEKLVLLKGQVHSMGIVGIAEMKSREKRCSQQTAAGTRKNKHRRNSRRSALKKYRTPKKSVYPDKVCKRMAFLAQSP